MVLAKKKSLKSSTQEKSEIQKPLIAVVMASSRQGSAVVSQLSKTNKFKIRALTRNPHSPKAQELNQLSNVEVIYGDLLNQKSLDNAFINAYGIFGNTTPTKGWRLGRGSIVPEYELTQGRNLIEATKKAANSGHLKHFIFSSVCKPKDPLKTDPSPGHFSSKWLIEEFILTKGLSQITTFLRPASYYENFNSRLPGVNISKTIFPGIVNPETKWQTIAVKDIGLWAKAAFLNPRKFIGLGINLASEELTGQEMSQILQKVIGDERNNVKYLMIPRVLIQLIEDDIASMASWIERTGYGANLNELNQLAYEVNIQPTSLASWLSEQLFMQRTFQPKRIAEGLKTG